MTACGIQNHPSYDAHPLAETVKATATPACFAHYASHGNWRWAPHLDYIDHVLVEASYTPDYRVIIQLPTRHGKSELCSVHFPAWYAGTFPKNHIIQASATEDLAMSFSVRSRDLLIEYGNPVFGVQVRKDIRARGHWELESGGSLRAKGAGGSFFGRGANLFIIDDYFGSADQALSEVERKKITRWYYATVKNRLEPKASVVIIASSTHQEDLNHEVIKEAELGGDKFRVVSFPAIARENDLLGRKPGEPLWPWRYSLEQLESIRRSLTAKGFEWSWYSLYQQTPLDVTDSEWPAEYFPDTMWYDEVPEGTEIIGKVMALDPSVGETEKADYSALVNILVARDLTCYIEADIQRRDVIRIINDTLSWYVHLQPQDFVVEGIAFQKVLKPLLSQEATRRHILFKGRTKDYHKLGKRQRIRRTVTPHLAQGRLRFKRNSPGTALLVEQLKTFPACKFDDGPDALQMALEGAEEWVNSR